MTGPRGHGGRPRDPGVDRRVLAAGRDALATKGLPGFVAEHIADAAGVGKASIYRRWPSLDHLLAAVVRELGVRPVDLRGTGTLFTDVARVLHAATSGPTEAAVLSAVGSSTELRVAYMAGPATRLVQAVKCVEVRARHRGEPEWPSVDPVLAAARLLMHQALVDGEQPSLLDVGQVVDTVVLPALRGAA